MQYCASFKTLIVSWIPIIGTWKCYKSGEVDLVTASVATNTAINFVHGAQE